MIDKIKILEIIYFL